MKLELRVVILEYCVCVCVGLVSGNPLDATQNLLWKKAESESVGQIIKRKTEIALTFGCQRRSPSSRTDYSSRLLLYVMSDIFFLFWVE